jgi:hypothetical protein
MRGILLIVLLSIAHSNISADLMDYWAEDHPWPAIILDDVGDILLPSTIRILSCLGWFFFSQSCPTTLPTLFTFFFLSLFLKKSPIVESWACFPSVDLFGKIVPFLAEVGECTVGALGLLQTPPHIGSEFQSFALDFLAALTLSATDPELIELSLFTCERMLPHFLRFTAISGAPSVPQRRSDGRHDRPPHYRLPIGRQRTRRTRGSSAIRWEWPKTQKGSQASYGSPGFPKLGSDR